MNNREIKLEIIKSSEHLVRRRYEERIERWNILLTQGMDPGIYPGSPTHQEYMDVANMMNNFVFGHDENTV